MGKYTDENNQNDITTNTTGQAYVEEENTSLMWNIGLKIFLSKAWSLRIDFLGSHYQAIQYGSTGALEEKYFEHFDLTFGINFAL